MSILAFKVETAIKDRVSKSPLGRSTIKAGEPCLVIQDYQGWKTNIKKSHAQKMLTKCLDQLNTEYKVPRNKNLMEKLTKEKTMEKTKIFDLNDYQLKPYNLTVSPKVQIRFFVLGIFAVYLTYKKFKKIKNPDMILSNGERINSNGTSENTMQKGKNIVNN